MSREAAIASITGTPAPVTPPVTAVPPAVQAQPNTSDAFAQLSRKEAAIVKERLQLKQDRELVAKERAESQAIIQREQQFEELKKKDVVQAMKSRGFSEQDIFNYLADNQPVELTPEQKAAKAAESAAEAKIKAWEEKQAKDKADERAKADTGLITGFKTTIAKTIEAEKDKYEYCAHHGPLAESLIYETVLAIIKDAKGVDVPSPQELRKQAIELVEEYYEEQDKSMSNIKKRNPTPLVTPEPTKAPERSRTVTDHRGDPVAPVKSRSLSNGPITRSASPLTETKDQKRERLIAKLRG
jgi:hypothetical protein